MRKIAALHILVLGILMVSTVSAYADTGLLRVEVSPTEVHFISYQVSLEQLVTELSDPARFRVDVGDFIAFEVFDDHLTRLIDKVSVEMDPTPRFPEGVEIDLPLTPHDPGDTGVDFFMRVAYPDAYAGTFQFTMKLTTGHKIKVDPFPMTFQRLPEVRNVQFSFSGDPTKPVVTWDSTPPANQYRVKVQDSNTGLRTFVGRTFPAAGGPVQTFNLNASPTPGVPGDWPGMPLGELSVLRIEARLRVFGIPEQVITLPASPEKVRVPAPVLGRGQITRSMSHVGFTP